MLTGVNRLKTTGRHGSQVEDAIPPTSTGAVASQIAADSVPDPAEFRQIRVAVASVLRIRSRSLSYFFTN